MKDSSIVVHIIWIPMLRSDSRLHAVDATLETTDSRITHFWDPNRLLGEAWGRSLALSQTAWDVYLLFSHQTVWKDLAAPYPDFWMHQLGAPGIKAPHLNPDTLTARLRKLTGS